MDEVKRKITGLSDAKRAILDQRVDGKRGKLTAFALTKTKQELSPLIFHSGGNGTPLFLFHYLSPSQLLAKHLGSDRPIYAIDGGFDEELHGWEESGRMAVSFEALAGRCIAQMKTAQPHGPYFLAGYCFGGALAFETANQLTRGGEHVEALGLLDAFYLPGLEADSVRWFMTNNAGKRESDRADSEKSRLNRIAFMQQILKPYKSPPYFGKVVLFRAMAGRDPSDRSANGWEGVVAGGIQVEDCQSTSKGLFEPPFVAELGARFAKHLATIDARLAPGSTRSNQRPNGFAVPNNALDEKQKSFVEPRTANEKILAIIWSEVLRIEQVGIHDKFFELGGDSILGIQVIAKAYQAGLRLTLKQTFQHQTIAELALAAKAVAPLHFEQHLVSGDVPLTPIQIWFLEQDYTDKHHWNQSRFLEMREEIEPKLFETAIQHLVIHHDALRSRFERDSQGWKQFNAGHEEGVKLEVVDLAAATKPEQLVLMESAAAKLQSSLNLSRGPLVRVALFDLGPSQPKRLLIAIHHLAVDGISWGILLEDLQTVYRQLQYREPIKLPAKTTSFQNWAQQLVERARSAGMEKECDYWLATLSVETKPIPLDSNSGENTGAFARTISVEMNAEETGALLKEVPQAYNTRINDILLSALGMALTSWTGHPMVRINLEGHGREELFEGVDLSRTVGWFTTIFPVNLDLRGLAGPGSVLKSVKEQLRRVPSRGIGYGMLRYLRGDETAAAQLRAQPQPQILFNYLGQFNQAAHSPWVALEESIGPAHSPLARRSHLLEINSGVANDRLRLDWRYSEAVHRHRTIEQLAQNFLESLRTLIQHCTSSEAGGYTPSDFPEAGLNQDELDSLMFEVNSPRGTE